MTSFFNNVPSKVLLTSYERTTTVQTGWWCTVQRITDKDILFGGLHQFDSGWLKEHVGYFFDDDIPF